MSSSFSIVAAIVLVAFASWPGAGAQNFNQICNTTGSCTNTAVNVCDTNRVTPVCRIQQGKGCTSSLSDPGCVAGATCNGNCTCTEGAAPGSGANASLCMGQERRVTGACAAAAPKCVENAACSATNTCVCSTNYQVHYADYTCVPGDGKVGGLCSSSMPCADSHSTCGAESKRCACNVGYTTTPALTCVPAEKRVGGACNISTANCSDANALCMNGTCVCKTGYITNQADTSCELDYGSPCTIAKKLECRGGSTCDPLLFHCSIVNGTDCKNHKDKCVSGATCDVNNNQCSCNISISSVASGLCVPKDGMVGGACSDTKPCGTNAQCNSTCTCLRDFYLKPETLTCVTSGGSSARTLVVPVIVLVMSLMM